jgi:hypothetical protein
MQRNYSTILGRRPPSTAPSNTGSTLGFMGENPNKRGKNNDGGDSDSDADLFPDDVKEESK